jgi:tetratricopeptide (TPR) repeat protein
MKLTSGFAALLIATSVVGGGLISGCGSQSGSSNQIQVLEPLKPLKVEQIDKIASEITVLIDTSSSGSGVLIAKERGWFDTTYYVLTAKHVIQGKNEFDIVTPDGERYRRSQNDVVEYLPDADLAVVQFASNKQYALARLTDWDFQNRSMYFEGYEKDISWAFVSGFPDPKQETEFPQQKRIFTVGNLRNATDAPFGGSDSSLTDGYELTYTASTYRGMSGSPVLDTSGRLIGIHGRNTGEQIEGNRRIVLGDSIGVPISKLLKATSEKLQKLTASLAIDKNIPLKAVDTPLDYQIALLRQDYQTFSKSCRDDRCLNYINRLIRIGADESAFKLIENYLSGDNNRKFYPAWFLRGELLMRLGKSRESLSSLDEAVRLNPDFYEAKINKCSYLWGTLKEYENSVKACDQGIEIIKRLEKSGRLKVKPPFNAWHQKATALSYMGKNKESIEAYNIAISISPNPHSYLNRGVSRGVLGDHKGAIEDYNSAIQINPKYIYGYVNRAFVRLGIADIEGANQDFDKAASINMEYTAKRLTEKRYYNSSNSQKAVEFENFLKKKAIELYSNLIDQKPNSPNLFDWYENRCILQSDFNVKSAIEDCNKSIALNPSALNTYRLRATLYKELGDYQKSISDYSKQIDLLPKSETYRLMMVYYGRCGVYFKIKKYDIALQDCQKSIKVHPVNLPKTDSNGNTAFTMEMLHKAKVHFQMGNIYSELKNYQMAIENYSSAIQLNEFDGRSYLNRAVYGISLIKILVNNDTNEIISLAVDSIDDSMRIAEDFQKAFELLKDDEDAKKILKNNVKSYRENLLSIQQQDETIKTILVKLKKLE